MQQGALSRAASRTLRQKQQKSWAPASQPARCLPASQLGTSPDSENSNWQMEALILGREAMPGLWLLGSSGSVLLSLPVAAAFQSSMMMESLEDMDLETSQANESKAHPVFFSLDYQHVQVPFEITLWIMLASLAKIGRFLQAGVGGLGSRASASCAEVPRLRIRI